VDAYTAAVELATAADADHARQRLDYLADYHAAITNADSNRAELILTLPAEAGSPSRTGLGRLADIQAVPD